MRGLGVVSRSKLHKCTTLLPYCIISLSVMMVGNLCSQNLNLLRITSEERSVCFRVFTRTIRKMCQIYDKCQMIFDVINNIENQMYDIFFNHVGNSLKF